MNMLKKSLLAAAIMAAGLQAANAGVTVSPMVGQYIVDDEMDVDNAIFGSLGLGYQFDGPIGVEFSYLGVHPEKDINGVELDIEQLRFDALYHFKRDEKVQPYILIGGGTMNYEDEGIETENTLVNIGGGIKANFAGGLGLRSEIRLINDSESELTNYSVGLGLIYEFGKKAMAPKQTVVEDNFPSDSDGDGVNDANDSCPGTPSGAAVDLNGCKMVMDADKDGIADALDQCPNTSAGAAVDINGCYIVITETKEVTMNIVFATNSSVVPSVSFAEIGEVADFMTQYPLTKVNIEGHTDDSGAAAYNQSLSQKRAEAVAQTLITRYGINPTRVSATGFGESQPMVDNSTAANRAKNRRVTAKVTADVETIKK